MYCHWGLNSVPGWTYWFQDRTAFLEPTGSFLLAQWVIRTESGKQLGPYPTEAVLKLIADGTLVGTEMIKKHPEGKWIPISRQADFYDRLLDALSDSVKPHEKIENKNEPEPPPTSENETVIAPPTNVTNIDFDKTVPRFPTKKSEDFENDDFQETQISKPESVLQKKTDERKASEIRKDEVTSETPLVNPYENTKSFVIKSSGQDRRNIKRMAFVAASVFFVTTLLILIWPFDRREQLNKPNLMAPRPSTKTSLTEPEIKSLFSKVLSSFLKDTYESYSEAQDRLVALIEGAPQNLEARGLLCLVYKELWPYVMQDEKDADAIFYVTQSTKSIDPIGINGTYCEIMKLMTAGKYREARGVVEHALNQPNFSTAPVLYALKAELLYEENDFRSALLYGEKAHQLWPDWIKPLYDLGKYQLASGRVAEAFQVYDQVLKRNPLHKRAVIDQGILLATAFQKNEEAVNILSTTLAKPGLLPKIQEAKAYLVLANIWAAAKNNSQARTAAQKAFILNPGDLRAKELLVRLGGSDAIAENQTSELIYLGDQYARTGNCLAAQAEYKTAFEMDKGNGIAAFKAAKCLWQISKSQEAIEWLNKAIRADKKLTSAYVLQADYLSQRYDYAAAVSILNRAASLFPNNYEVLRGFGLVEVRRNNLKDALAFLQRATKIYPNDVETLVLLAKALGMSRDFVSAQRTAAKAIELDSTSNEAHIIYAKLLAQSQGLDSGVVYIKDLITKYSYNIEFRLALAEMYKEHDKFVEAQKIYEQILAVDPKNRESFIGLGESLQAQGMFDKALKMYLNAAVSDPSDPEAFFKAGRLYFESGKYTDAIVQFQRALAVNAFFPRLHLYIGKSAFEAGQYEQALKEAMEERRVNPNLSDSYLLAAEIYAASKQYQKCAGEYQQALKLRPQGADIYVRMARCYRQGGNIDIAENMLNIAASQESGLPEIYKEQGAVYEQKGDLRSAAQAYNKYLALSPNAPDRTEIENRILSLGGRN